MAGANIDNATHTEYIRIAHYYYNAGMTQQEIALRMGTSRQRINRILTACIDMGIVKITIEGAQGMYLDLETKLEKVFGLKKVRVCDISQPDDYNSLGKAIGDLLKEVVRNGDIIGFGRGKTLAACVRNMPEINDKKLIVTQLMGGQNERHIQTSNDDIVLRFARKTNAESYLIHAPVLVNNKQARDILMSEPTLSDTFNILHSCTIAVCGIGDVASHRQLFEHQIGDEGWQKVKQTATGEICTHFYDENGRRISSSLDERIIALNESEFKAIPLRIGIGGGLFKAPAILGAIRGKFINALVTDFQVAEQLLKNTL